MPTGGLKLKPGAGPAQRCRATPRRPATPHPRARRLPSPPAAQRILYFSCRGLSKTAVELSVTTDYKYNTGGGWGVGMGSCLAVFLLLGTVVAASQARRPATALPLQMTRERRWMRRPAWQMKWTCEGRRAEPRCEAPPHQARRPPACPLIHPLMPGLDCCPAALHLKDPPTPAAAATPP